MLDSLPVLMVKTFFGFFAIMNPFANTPIFVGLVGNFDEPQKRAVARRSVLTAFVVVAVFCVAGKYIFEIFGLTLPDVSTGADLESALTPAFFETIVAGETRRAIQAVGDPQRVVPWLEAGRTPHDGDPMTAGPA